MTKEQVIRKHTTDAGDNGVINVSAAMDEWGQIQYNQALEDASKEAVTIFDKVLINEIMLSGGSKVQYTDNDLIYKPSILKLKKK